MKKRILSVLLIALLVLFPVLHTGAYYKSPGPTVLLLNEDIINTVNVEVLGANAFNVGEGGGEVSYDFLNCFPLKSITFVYSSKDDCTVTATFDGVTAEAVLPKDQTTAVIELGSTVTDGDKYATIKFSTSIDINSVNLNQQKWTSAEWGWAVDGNYVRCGFSPDEEAIHSAVIIKEASSAILVNGATRYIDNNDISQKPVYIDGNLCLPIHTFARAFSFYYEDKPELKYALLREDQKEFYLKDGKTYTNINHHVEEADLPIYLKDGKTFVGVRYFAEAIGENVLYDNGTVYIDFRNINQKIMKNESAKAYAESLLSPFIVDETVGVTYYVAQTINASDDNPGTVTAPFKTLAKAAEVAKAGDTVIVRKGTYREILAPKNDGTAKSPITFKAAEGEEVILSATEEITEFVRYNDKGWLAAPYPYNLGFSKNQVFYKNDCIIEARYPNDPVFDMGEGVKPLHKLYPTRGDFYLEDDSITLTSPSGLLDQEEKNIWSGAIYNGGFGYAWTMTSYVVQESEKGKITLGEAANVYNYGAEKGHTYYDWGYLTGVEACMDLPGEWIIKGDTLVLIPPEGETAETLKIEAKARQIVANLNNRKFVHLEGFKTFGGSITMEEAEMCMLNGLDMKFISHAVYMDDAREGYIDRNSTETRATKAGAPHRGEVGVYISGKNNIVVNSDFNYSAFAALYISGLYTYVENNIINETGYMVSYVGGITVLNDPRLEYTKKLHGGSTIIGNTISRVGRSCYLDMTSERVIGWPGIISPVPHEVAYNNFNDGILFALDGGLTYEYGNNYCTDRHYSKLHHNYMYYTPKEQNPFAFGQYHDGYTDGIQTYENIVFTTQEDVGYTIDYLNVGWGGMNNHIFWNNIETLGRYIENGPENLKLFDYPNNYPFYAGAQRFSKDYMNNYSGMNDEYIRLSSDDAILHGNVHIGDDKSIVFDGTDGYVEYKDIDFGEFGMNSATVYFKGDTFAKATVLEIGIGESYEKAIFSAIDLSSLSVNENRLNSNQKTIDNREGVMNVYVRLANCTDEQFVVDNIIFNNFPKNIEPHHGSFIYGGKFDLTDKIGDPSSPPRLGTRESSEDEPYAYQIWTGSAIRYKNVTMPENAKVFFYNIGVADGYEGQEIVFSYYHNGDPTPTEFARIRTVNNGWATKDDTKYIELPEVIEGQVDIFVTMGETVDGTEGVKATCNLFSFGFLDKIPDEK